MRIATKRNHEILLEGKITEEEIMTFAKQIIIQLVCIGIVLCSCSSNRPHVHAEIEGLENDTIYVFSYPSIKAYYETQGDESAKRDTLVAQNGVFQYRSESKEPQLVNFLPLCGVYTKSNGSKYLAQQKAIILLLEPNKSVTLKGKMHNHYIEYIATGSEFNLEGSTLRNSYIEESSNAVALELKIDSMGRLGPSEELNALYKERNKYNRIAYAEELEYVKNNLDKDLSAYYLTRQSPKSIMELSDKLSPEIRNGLFGYGLDKKLTLAKKNLARKQAYDNIKLGKIAPSFALKDLEGNVFKLNSDHKKKYIVLDFWGSWCPPCIKGLPQMKSYYKKYIDDLDIIGISCNDDVNKWTSTVKDHGLDWKNVINDADLERDVSVMYGVNTYPTKFILDKNLTILEKYEGETQNFYNKIDSLLR